MLLNQRGHPFVFKSRMLQGVLQGRRRRRRRQPLFKQNINGDTIWGRLTLHFTLVTHQRSVAFMFNSGKHTKMNVGMETGTDRI